MFVPIAIHRTAAASEQVICTCVVLIVAIRATELVTLVVDPNEVIGPEDSRFFITEIYVNATLIGGMVFEGVCEQTCQWLLILVVILIVVIAVATIIWFIRRD